MAVPTIYSVILLLSLSVNIVWQYHQSMNPIQVSKLPPVPGQANVFHLFALGETQILAKVLMYWLQSFDNQPGVSLAFADLDYALLHEWLEQIQVLDPQSQYALFSASYIYGFSHDEAKLREIFNFVETQFIKQPERNWRWLAHMAIIAKHRLKDLDQALVFAKLLRLKTRPGQIPAWARQMEIGLLEEKGEYESARLLVGGLISEGQIKDQSELIFLNQRLQQLKNQ